MNQNLSGDLSSQKNNIPSDNVKSKAQKLVQLKQRVKKATISFTVRLHKTVRTLLKMYPGAVVLAEKSLFDKNYLVHMLLNSENWKSDSIDREVLSKTLYELEADKLLSEGGIK